MLGQLAWRRQAILCCSLFAGSLLFPCDGAMQVGVGQPEARHLLHLEFLVQSAVRYYSTHPLCAGSKGLLACFGMVRLW